VGAGSTYGFVLCQHGFREEHSSHSTCGAAWQAEVQCLNAAALVSNLLQAIV